MLKYLSVVILLFVVGCGPSQPPELKNAVVTVVGSPNADVYLSVNTIRHTVNGRESSTTGGGSYGKRALDENGRWQETFNSAHGLDVVLVALNDEPLTLTIKADDIAAQSAEVSGQLKVSQLKIGYHPDPDSMFANKPEDSVYGAKQYIDDGAGEE